MSYSLKQNTFKIGHHRYKLNMWLIDSELKIEVTLHFGGTFYSEGTHRCLHICPQVKRGRPLSLMVKGTCWE